MFFLRIIWDDPDDPSGNVQQIQEHGLTIEEVEEVLLSPEIEGRSVSSGRPCCWGHTLEEVYLIVVFDMIDSDSLRVVTAFEVPEPS